MLTLAVIVLGLLVIAGSAGLCLYIYQIFEIRDEFRKVSPIKEFMECYHEVRRARMRK